MALTMFAAPPECWRNEDTYLQNCDIQVTQKVDIWALGCIYAEVMVWIARGWSGLAEFRHQRFEATKLIDGFKDGDCFHDGESRLQVVDDWLDRAVDEGPKSDYVSPLLIHLVKEMLDETAEQRPDCIKLRHRTQKLLEQIERKYPRDQSRDIATPLPLPESPYGQPPTDPRSATRSSKIRPSSGFHSSNSPNLHLDRDSTPPSSPPNGSSPDGYGFEWRSSREHEHSDDSLCQEAKMTRRSADSTVLRSSSAGSHHALQKRASHGRQRPLLDQTSSIRRVSVPRELSTKQASTVLGSVIEDSTTKQKAPVPPWPIRDAFSWREQRKEPKKMSLSNIPRLIGREPEKSKFANITGHDHLMELKDRDHVRLYDPALFEIRANIFQIIVIDDSSSMRIHKSNVANMAGLLVYALKGFDSDGIDMHLPVARKARTIANSKYLSSFLSESTFTGECNMAHCLGQIFEAYKEKINSHAKGLKPTNIYVLTDAVWQPKCEVDAQIINFVQYLVSQGQWSRQVGIQFIRFGDSEDSRICLETLDTLKQRGLTKWYLRPTTFDLG